MKQPHYKYEILNVIQEILPEAKVYLFGSRARGTYQEGANVNLALDTGDRIDSTIILHIKKSLYDTTMPLFVDIVDMYSIPESFKKDILTEGIVWRAPQKRIYNLIPLSFHD